MRRLPVLLLACATAGSAGCGRSDRDQVKDTVRAFRQATADRDYAKICKDILAKDLAGRLDQLGLPCETALSKYLVETRKPKLTVRRVRVKGDEATVFVTSSAQGQAPAQDQLRLVEEDDDWRIASLGKS